jgi:hypothetical protein
MELVTLKETKKARIYDFIEIDEEKNIMIHKQFENRSGQIFMRSKVRIFKKELFLKKKAIIKE